MHRDAFQDVCDETRQNLVEGHEASLASSNRRDDCGGASQDAAQTTQQQETPQSQKTDDNAGGDEQMTEPGRATEQTRQDKVKQSEGYCDHAGDVKATHHKGDVCNRS